jgi:hypothetical protein
MYNNDGLRWFAKMLVLMPVEGVKLLSGEVESDLTR